MVETEKLLVNIHGIVVVGVRHQDRIPDLELDVDVALLLITPPIAPFIPQHT